MAENEGLVILGFIIVMVGWAITHFSRLEHEKARYRLSKKIEAYESVLRTISKLADADYGGNFHTKWKEGLREQAGHARISVRLFGTPEEVNIFETLVHSMQTGTTEETREHRLLLAQTLLNQLRKELGLAKVDIVKSELPKETQ